MSAMNVNTPTKKVTRSKTKPSEKVPDDFCRVCKCSFQLKKIAWFKFNKEENIDGTNVLLASLCKSVCGFNPKYNDCLSNRVCKSCGRKIHNLGLFCKQLKESINQAHEQFGNTTNSSPGSDRYKRELPTSVTPERSPAHRKQQKSEQKASRPKSNIQRRTLSFTDKAGKHCEDEEFNLLNIEEFNDSPKTEIKVLLVRPCGVTLRTVPDRDIANMVKNLVLKRWKAVANAIVKHEKILLELAPVVGRKVSEEFKNLSKSDSVLKGTDPRQLETFSNKLVLEETSLYLPIWNACIRGACGVKVNESPGKPVTNSIVLATSVAARARNRTMSAIAYRISVVLYHGGLSYQASLRLFHLGICMHPESAIGLQKRMGKDHDAKVLTWKKDLETDILPLKLMEEIRERQIPCFQADDMVIERSVDLSETSVNNKTCPRYFDAEALKLITNVLNAAECKSQTRLIGEHYSEEVFEDAFSEIARTKTSRYK
ncbi:Hypothetical predicted protein [Paramuricea clavata]|uniref:Uncharacterized protein n=1 Tax=Paramuricea clavata TaxID=317549 RepID=A0A6S7LTP2_PARCT|nr:Hypothetical predicted protein [Paramuricea clavata]